MSRSEAGKLGALKSQEGIAARKLKVREDYYKNPKQCPNCKIAIPFDKRFNKFCSRSCSTTVNNVGVCRNGATSTKTCLQCGLPISSNNKTYCNRKCHADHKWCMAKEAIESGEYMDSVGENAIRSKIKRYLIERNGHQCEICNTTTWMGNPIPLVCDHIDGNADNNDLTNFRIVCGNCDMQLPTYKSKNRGNGRKHRRILKTILK